MATLNSSHKLTDSFLSNHQSPESLCWPNNVISVLFPPSPTTAALIQLGTSCLDHYNSLRLVFPALRLDASNPSFPQWLSCCTNLIMFLPEFRYFNGSITLQMDFRAHGICFSNLTSWPALRELGWDLGAGMGGRDIELESNSKTRPRINGVTSQRPRKHFNTKGRRGGSGALCMEPRRFREQIENRQQT